MPMHRRSTNEDQRHVDRVISAEALASMQLALGKPAPKNHFPQGTIDPDVAAAVIKDELLLDGNARLNLATFVTTWMEPQAEALMADVLRQEHDRQGRVPADRGARAALREHARRPVERARQRRRRLLDDRVQRGLHARRRSR